MEAPPPPPPPAHLGQNDDPPPPPPFSTNAVPNASPYDLLYQRQPALGHPLPPDNNTEQQHSQREQGLSPSQADNHYPPPPDMQPHSEQPAPPAEQHAAAQQPDTQISQEQYANMSEQDQNTYWQQWYEYEQYQQWQQQDQARQWEAYYASQIQPQHQQASYDAQNQQHVQYQPYQQYQPPQAHQQQPQQQPQQQQWSQQADPYSQYQQYATPAAQLPQAPQQAHSQASYHQQGSAYASIPQGQHMAPAYAPSQSGPVPSQPAYALPHPPTGPSAAMQLAAGLHLAPPKKPAVPDWVRQELLKRGLQNDASGVQARGGSDNEGDDVAAKQPRRFTEKGSGSGSRWGSDAGILAAKDRQQRLAEGDSEDDSEAEAEEAERQARVSLEIKKSLTHILLHVTDSLFDDMAQEVCQESTNNAHQKDALGAGSAVDSEHESDSAAVGGADLLGLGYTSDGDSQDSASKSKPAKPNLSEAAAETHASKATADSHNGVKIEPVRDPSMSPSAAAGGWVKREEEESKPDMPDKPFVKGQRLWYLERDGVKAAGTLVSVDESVVPPSYAVKIDKTSSVRETEGHRLQHMLADDNKHDAIKVEAPAAVSSLEQIIQSMQQIKAAASVQTPNLTPKATPLFAPPARPSASIVAQQPDSPAKSNGQHASPQLPAGVRLQSVATATGQTDNIPIVRNASASIATGTDVTQQHSASQSQPHAAAKERTASKWDRPGAASKQASDTVGMQASPSKAAGDAVDHPAGDNQGQAHPIEARASLETELPKDSKAQKVNEDAGQKRSRGKEKEPSKVKHSRKDKRPSRDERRRSISRSRSRTPKRRKASSSPVRASTRSRRRTPSPARRRTRDDRSPVRRHKSPSPAVRRSGRHSRSPPRKRRTPSPSRRPRSRSPSPARQRRSSRSPARHRRRSQSNDRRRKDSPNPGRRRRSSVPRRSSSPVRR